MMWKKHDRILEEGTLIRMTLQKGESVELFKEGDMVSRKTAEADEEKGYLYGFVAGGFGCDPTNTGGKIFVTNVSVNPVATYDLKSEWESIWRRGWGIEWFEMPISGAEYGESQEILNKIMDLIERIENRRELSNEEYNDIVQNKEDDPLWHLALGLSGINGIAWQQEKKCGESRQRKCPKNRGDTMVLEKSAGYGEREEDVEYRVYDIEWDTDGIDEGLPEEMTVVVPADEDDDEEYIANYITDDTGFCHKGFRVEKIIYQEHLKLEKILNETHTISHFIEWMLYKKEYQISEWIERELICGKVHHHNGLCYKQKQSGWKPIKVNIRALVDEYFGIDQQKMDKEQKKMLEAYQK